MEHNSQSARQFIANNLRVLAVHGVILLSVIVLGGGIVAMLGFSALILLSFSALLAYIFLGLTLLFMTGLGISCASGCFLLVG